MGFCRGRLRAVLETWLQPEWTDTAPSAPGAARGLEGVKWELRSTILGGQTSS